MRRGAAARVAGEPDPLIALHALTLHDVDGVEVTVAALDVTPMIDDDDVAVASRTAGEAHHARSARLHRCSGRGRQIDASMELGRAGPRGTPQTESGIDRAAHREPRRQRGEDAAGFAGDAREGTETLTLVT